MSKPRLLCYLAGVSLLLLLASDLFGIRLNKSESIPYKVLLHVLQRQIPQKGDIVTFERFGKILAKEVIGLPGDFVRLKEGSVFVGEQEVGEVLTVSPSGVLLDSLEEQTIPEGFCFCMGHHPHSFDSRYSQIGLVAFDELKERLCPLF